MKRFNLNRVVVAIAMLLIGWLPSLAHDFEVDGIFYKKTGGNTVSVAYKGNNVNDYENEYFGAVNIPSSVTFNGVEYSVTRIGDCAFQYCNALTSIEISNSITSIKESAFEGCTGLVSIEIPNSVTLIDDYAFCGCTGLTSIEIPNSVTRINEGIFIGCTNLAKVQIPNSITIIKDFAFRRCSSLTNIEFPSSVYNIGVGAFWECTDLATITCLSTNPPTIQSDTFEKSTYNKATLYVPESCKYKYQTAYYWNNFNIKEIGDDDVNHEVGTKFSSNGLNYIITVKGQEIAVAQYDSDNKYSGDIIIPQNIVYEGVTYNVTSIDENAFYGCNKMTSIEIPNSVTSIGEYAFTDCSGLTSIVIPSGITVLKRSVFDTCYNLTSIEIPNGVTSIEKYAFSNCYALESVIIPNSVTSIGEAAFSVCRELTSIVIPNSVTSIGERAFGQCSKLASIVVNDGNTVFDSRDNCNAIIQTASNTLICGSTETVIPDSVIRIGDSAFTDRTGITSIEIPNSVRSIGQNAFSGCSNLTQITCLATNPPSTVSNSFISCPANLLYVPAGCKSAYEASEYWKGFNIKEIVTLSTSISLNKTSATLRAAESFSLVATILPENATNKTVTWESSNTAVATVDANGKVTAVAVGEATITATTADGSNKSSTCKITVAKTLATSISLDKTSATLKATETLTLKATVSPATTTDKSVTW